VAARSSKWYLVVPILAALMSASGCGSGDGAPHGARILAVGDFGTGGKAELRTGRAMRSFEQRHSADLLLTLGDNDYTDSPTRFERNWQKSFGWLGGAGVKVAGTLGNHDVETQNGLYEQATLNMSGRYYKRSVGCVDLFVLDSNRIDPQQTAWLDRVLAESKACWKLPVFHHPAYTCGAYSSARDVVASWVPLFERHGVRLALAGHDHDYQRFAPQKGVTYVVHGGGGQALYSLRRCPRGYPRRVFARSAYGFLYINAEPELLSVFAIDRSGRPIDRVKLFK
jgi:tartrate-resistant acid phosphatase type 5